MEILLVAEDRLVRDQVKVGLQQFPEFSVTTGEGYAAINEARQREFDCVFLGVDFAGTDGFRLLEQHEAEQISSFPGWPEEITNWPPENTNED